MPIPPSGQLGGGKGSGSLAALLLASELDPAALAPALEAWGVERASVRCEHTTELFHSCARATAARESEKFSGDWGGLGGWGGSGVAFASRTCWM
jgi:hypothetical protein